MNLSLLEYILGALAVIFYGISGFVALTHRSHAKFFLIGAIMLTVLTIPVHFYGDRQKNENAISIDTVKQSQPVDTPVSPYTTPTPRQIQESIRKQPPYDRESFAKNYLGLRVRWRLSIGSVDHEIRDTVRVILRDEPSMNSVLAAISLRDCPKLRIVAEKEPVDIVGTIDKINLLYIRLSGAKITFPNP